MMKRKEECRHAVLNFLAERSRLAYDVSGIRRNINRFGGDFTDEEVAEAVELLVGLDFATVEPDGLGATRYYKVSGPGILQHERGQA